MSTVTPVPIGPSGTRYRIARIGLTALMMVNAILISAAVAIALISGPAPATTPGRQPVPVPAPAPRAPW
jgi:hypothetical protein